MSSAGDDFVHEPQTPLRNDSFNTKRNAYVPRNSAIKIRPLNMDDIKKEFEEETFYHIELDDKIKKKSPKSFNIEKLSPLIEIQEKSIHCHSIEMKDEPDIGVSDLNPDESSSEKVKKKNDSFDIDFSCLSLITPVKNKDKNTASVVPITSLAKINNPIKSKFEHQFITPKINTVQKLQCNVASKPPVRTPQNKYSVDILNSLKKVNSSSDGFIKRPTPLQTNTKENIPISECSVPSSVSVDVTFDTMVVKNVKYMIMNVLGRGGSSEVFNCFNLEKKINVAIKCVSLENPATAPGYINEVKLLESLQKCDRIIKMFDYEILELEKKLIMVLQKGDKDLSAVLKNIAEKQTHVPVYMILFYWLEMLYGVQQIHMNGVIHADLKPANFLSIEGRLKLIDFGIASSVQDDNTCVYKTTQEGSCNYISPEALNNETISTTGSPNFGKPKYKLHYKSDVWSLGCILYQLIYRRTPFQHLPQMWSKLAAIMDPNYKISYPPADWVSPKIVKTVKKCLQYDVKSRPSVDDLIAECEEMLRNL